MKKFNYLQFALLFAVLVIALLPLAEARLGVWKDYDANTKTISIRNLLNDPVVELQLLENTEQCISCHAIIKINSRFDLDLSVAEYYLMNFVKAKGSLESWSWKWYYLEDEVYQYSCKTGEKNSSVYDSYNKTWSYPKQDIIGNCTGTRQIQKIIDEKNDFIQKNRDYYILLEGNLKIGSAVEWIPTFYGVELNEWAWWNSDWLNAKNITMTNPEAAYHENEYIEVNVTGLTLATNNCTKELVIVNNASNQIAAHVLYNNTAADGSEWCYVSFLANISSSEVLNYTAYYNNLNANEQDEKITFTANATNRTSVWGFEENKNDDFPAGWLGSTAYVVTTASAKSGAFGLDNQGTSGSYEIDRNFTTSNSETMITSCFWYKHEAATDANDDNYWQLNSEDAWTNNHKCIIDSTTLTISCWKDSAWTSAGVGYPLNAWQYLCHEAFNTTNANIWLQGTKNVSNFNFNNVGTSSPANFKAVAFLTQRTSGLWDDIKIFKGRYYGNSNSTYTIGAEMSSTPPNTAPTIVAKTLTPASPVTTDNLVCTTNITDADGSAKLSGNLTFFRNNIASYSFNQSVTSGTNISVTLGEGNTTTNDVYICQIDAYDGTAHTLSNTSSVTIQSFPLSIDLNWTDLPAYTNKTKNYSFKPYGSSGSYNVSVNLYNGSALYVSYLVSNLANNTLFSNTTTAGHSGETWNVSVNTSHEDTLKINSTTVLIQNTAPQIDTAVVINATSATKLTLQINFSYNASDVDSDSLTYNYRWYKNNIAINTTSLLTNRSYSKNDVLIAEGWVNDSSNANSSLVNSSSLTIGNTAPTIDTAVVINATSATKLTLAVNMSSNSSDVDSDARTENFRWYVNNIPANRTSSISNKTYVKNDVLIAEMWVNDSSNVNSSLVNSSSLTIGNAAPSLTSDVVMNVTSATKTTTQINCSFNSTDADADALTENFRWYKNNIFSNTTSFITNRTFSKNDVLICEGWVNDGTDNSTLTNSSSLTISNTAPRNTSEAVLNVTSATKLTTQINASMNYTDDDNDALTLNFKWFINNTATSNTTSFITNRSFSKSEVIMVQVWVSDNAPSNSTLSNTTSINVSNTAPTIDTSVVINATSATRLTLQINFSYNASDVDASDSLTYNYRWYKNNIFINSTSLLTNKSWIKNDILIAEGWAYDGTSNSSLLNSSSLTIGNAAPSTPVLTSPSNNSNISTRNVTLLYNSDDVDGDTITYYFYVDNQINKTTTTNSTLINISDGSHNWTVKAGDGTGNSSNASYSLFTVDSTLPVLTITAPTGEYFAYGLPYNNLNITFNYTENNPSSCWYNLDSPSIEVDIETSASNSSPTLFDGSSSPTLAYDEDWSTLASSSNNDVYIWENFTANGTNLVWTGKYHGVGTSSINISYWNYSKGNWQQLTDNFNGGGNTSKFPLPSDSVSDNLVRIRHLLHPVSELYQVGYYEGEVSTNYTLLSSCINTTFNVSTSGNHTLHLHMNDTFGNSGSKTSNFTINLLNSSSQFIDGNISESQKITFTLQINSSNLTSINATLLWNSTNYYYDTLSNNSRQANLTKIIYMPLVNFSSWNASWNWNYTINEIHTNQTTNQTSQIWQINLTNCSAGTTLRTINFSYANEKTLSKMVGDLDATFTLWKDKISINRSFAFSSDNRSSAEFCIYPDWANYSAGMYGIFTTSSYTQRSYYLINEIISNSTKNLTLYHLNTTDATNLVAKVKDKISNLLKNVYVKMYRFYPDLNEWRLVEVGKTDTFGQTILHVVQNEVDYKFILIQNGAEVYTGLGMRIICVDTTTQPCSYEFVVGAEGDIIIDLIAGISHRLLYNNNTGYVNFDFSSISGLAKKVILTVIQRNVTGETTICNSTITSTSGTLSCHIGNKSGVFYGRAYSDTILVNLIVVTLKGALTIATSIFRADGIIWSVILIVTLFLIGIWNPVVAIGLSLLGLAVTAIFGLAALPVAFVIGLFILGVITMLKLRT